MESFNLIQSQMTSKSRNDCELNKLINMTLELLRDNNIMYIVDLQAD